MQFTTWIHVELPSSFLAIVQIKGLALSKNTNTESSHGASTTSCSHGQTLKPRLSILVLAVIGGNCQK
jgi:hypothetical protein